MSADSKPQRSEKYFMDFVIFLVEGCLFKVPRRPFEANSPVFRDMFALPVAPGSAVDGACEDSPLRLEGVKKWDFEQLLRVLVPLFDQSVDTLDTRGWVAILELASMWDMDNLCALAIKTLTPEKMDPTRRYVLAQRFNIREWVRPALLELVLRDEPIRPADLGELGIDMILKLVQAREERVAQGVHSCRYTDEDYNFEPCGAIARLTSVRSTMTHTLKCEIGHTTVKALERWSPDEVVERLLPQGDLHQEAVPLRPEMRSQGLQPIDKRSNISSRGVWRPSVSSPTRWQSTGSEQM